MELWYDFMKLVGKIVNILSVINLLITFSFTFTYQTLQTQAFGGFNQTQLISKYLVIKSQADISERRVENWCSYEKVNIEICKAETFLFICK